MKKIQNTIKMAAVIVLFAAATAQAQITPQAVIGNAPSLPTPQQWAANGGHTDAFKAKIAELDGKLSQIQAAMMPEVTQADLQQAKANQQRQQQQQTLDMQNAQKNIEQAQDFMAMLNLTEAEIKKLEKMSDKQAEAFIRKRMEEKGINPAQFTTDYSEEEQRRDRQAEAQGKAMIKAQETLDAYMEQMKITGNKISEAEKSATNHIAALWESRKDAIQKAAADCNQPEEVMRGTISKAQLDSYCRRHQSLLNDYNAAAYQIWATEYIGVAQGHLKFLLPYAQAADDAKKAQSTAVSTGNAAVDRLQGMSNCAISVAGQYLQITESEPR
jgi:hypothetical protein